MPSEPDTPSPRRPAVGTRALLLIAALALPALWVYNRTVPGRATPGLSGGRLAPCPDRPNCACSETQDPAHRVDPLPWTHGEVAGRARIREVVGSLRGARLVEEQPGYLRFEFTTTICRFIDDVEFRFDPAAGVIHVRSASRVGYSDLGTHRRRLEEIRRRLGP